MEDKKFIRDRKKYFQKKMPNHKLLETNELNFYGLASLYETWFEMPVRKKKSYNNLIGIFKNQRYKIQKELLKRGYFEKKVLTRQKDNPLLNTDDIKKKVELLKHKRELLEVKKEEIDPKITPEYNTFYSKIVI